jgi:hypothetical protein
MRCTSGTASPSRRKARRGRRENIGKSGREQRKNNAGVALEIECFSL